MSHSAHKNILKNQKGILTLDFIFATLMMFSFSAILFGFTMTFTAIEIAQYATFASARTYFAAHKNENEQKQLAKQKFNFLVKDKQSSLGNLFRNNWFELTDVELGDYNGEFSQKSGTDSETFIGARTQLVANILKMNFPLLGSTSDSDLSTSISSYLMREPTEEECADFTEQRFEEIKNLKSGFSSGYVQDAAYIPIMDDGC